MTHMALDVNRPETQQAINNPALLQQAVDAAFGGVSVHCLWRLEVLNHRMHLLLLSPLRPTLGPAHQQYGYPGAFPSWETWSYDDDLYDLHPGMRLHFRLEAATCAPMDAGESVQRMAQETSAFQLAWLKDHRDAWGFTYEDRNVEVLQSAWITWCEPEEPDRRLTCHHATFDGELMVTDAELFMQALTQGIGEHDRMGAGLMTLDQVQNYRYV